MDQSTVHVETYSRRASPYFFGLRSAVRSIESGDGHVDRIAGTIVGTVAVVRSRGEKFSVTRINAKTVDYIL